MNRSELSEKNFKRITVTNWTISIPLIFLFAWPYLYICRFMNIEVMLAYAGSVLFAVPFMTTIVHGNVTMALGSVHRNHYYDWLADQNLTYGLFFSRLFIRTRFRLVMIVISLLLMAVGHLIKFD